MANFCVLQHLDDALTIGAVRENRDLSRGGHAGLKNGFDAVGPAALEQNCFPALRAGKVREFEQTFAHAGDQGVELEVPRSGIVKHRLLHGGARLPGGN